MAIKEILRIKHIIPTFADNTQSMNKQKIFERRNRLIANKGSKGTLDNRIIRIPIF